MTPAELVLPHKTREEVGRLKADWYSDGGWDLEDAEGFEAHREELLAYRKEVEATRARRRAAEHDEAINAFLRPALASLPERDPLGGLTRSAAASSGHGSHRLLRAVAEMLLPIVQRLDRIDAENDKAHLGLADDIDKLFKR